MDITASQADLDPVLAVDPNTQASVRILQIRLLYENLRAGLRLSGTALMLVMTAVWLLGPVPLGVLIWGGATLAWIGAGFVIHWAYRRHATDTNLHQWALRAAIGSTFAGILWGGCGWCLLDPASLSLAPLFITVVALVALGVFTAYACYLPAMFGFILGMTTTFSLAMLWLGDGLYLSIAAFLALTAALALVSGRNFNRLLSAEILTRLRNDRLVRELTQKQTEVESANLAKTRFLAAASHDLRQPVHAINLYAEVLRGQVPAGEGRVALQSMTKSIQALDGLFESIEDIAKFEAGIVTARIADADLGQIVESLRATYDESARAKGLQLHIPRGAWRVRTDPVLLRRILGNLLSNAIRYTDTGSVRIDIEQDADSVRITVRDSGIGIPQDRIDDIFREYVQLHNPERNRNAGLGLGLNIVKRLADLLEHPLRVASSLGAGSAFTITVPLSTSAPAEDSTPAPDARETSGLAGAFVAVIDDEPAVLESTELLLRAWHCHVLTATSGDEALALLAREQRFPDLIISDFRLRNDESGIDVIARIRSALEVKVPALLISGDIDPARVREAYDAGLTLLHKPVQATQLRDAMTRWLTTRLD